MTGDIDLLNFWSDLLWEDSIDLEGGDKLDIDLFWGVLGVFGVLGVVTLILLINFKLILINFILFKLFYFNIFILIKSLIYNIRILFIF